MKKKISSVSDMHVIVKARELQRATLAAMSTDPTHASKHYLAAAHLELVLSDDYTDAGNEEMAFRSRLSAGSCLWLGGAITRGRRILTELLQAFPDRADTIRHAIADLKTNAKPVASKSSGRRPPKKSNGAP